MNELRAALASEQQRCRELNEENTRLKFKELPEIERRYRSLFDTIQEGFAFGEIILDEEGNPSDYRILGMNETYGLVSEFSREADRGRTVREVFQRINPFWIQFYARVALSGKPEMVEHYAAGLKKWFEVYAFSPEPGRFCSLLLDITERKRTEKSLQ